jgi:hypothetical protein
MILYDSRFRNDEESFCQNVSSFHFVRQHHCLTQFSFDIKDYLYRMCRPVGLLALVRAVERHSASSTLEGESEVFW